MGFLKIIFKASTLWADAFYKSICPYVCLSVCMSVCVCVHFWTHKSWKFLLIKCVKLPRKKRLFLGKFCFTKQDFFLYFSLRSMVFLPPLPKVQCPNFLDFLNPFICCLWQQIVLVNPCTKPYIDKLAWPPDHMVGGQRILTYTNVMGLWEKLNTAWMPCTEKIFPIVFWNTQFLFHSNSV